MQGSIALLYVLSGLFGTCVSIIFLPGVTSVGASGSLFGLIGAQVGGSPHHQHLRLLSLPTLQSPLPPRPPTRHHIGRPAADACADGAHVQWSNVVMNRRNAFARKAWKNLNGLLVRPPHPGSPRLIIYLAGASHGASMMRHCADYRPHSSLLLWCRTRRSSRRSSTSASASRRSSTTGCTWAASSPGSSSASASSHVRAHSPRSAPPQDPLGASTGRFAPPQTLVTLHAHVRSSSLPSHAARLSPRGAVHAHAGDKSGVITKRQHDISAISLMIVGSIFVLAWTSMSTSDIRDW